MGFVLCVQEACSTKVKSVILELPRLYFVRHPARDLPHDQSHISSKHVSQKQGMNVRRVSICSKTQNSSILLYPSTMN
jgi:hypothetical protein